MTYTLKFVLHRLIPILAVAVLSSYTAVAGGPMLGIFNSTKGFGLCLENNNGNNFDAFIVYLDMYGMYAPRTDVPGFKFNYSHNHIFRVFDKKEYSVQLYVGPGCSAGYVHDFEGGRDNLSRNPGGVLALSCTGGCRMPFTESRFCLDFSLRAEVGAHIRRNNELSVNSLSFYLNGLIQTIAPQLTILYSF